MPKVTTEEVADFHSAPQKMEKEFNLNRIVSVGIFFLCQYSKDGINKKNTENMELLIDVFI